MKILTTPIPAVRMTKADRWRKRPAVLRYFEYKDVLRGGYPCDRLPETIKLLFVMPMPKSWSEKRRVIMDGKPHKQRPDTDNLTKAVKDSFGEDSYIWSEHATKIWGRVGSVTIEELIIN